MTATTRPRACQYGNDRDTPPTARQREVFDFIVSHVLEHLYQPSLREISAHIGCSSSTNAVFGHLKALRQKGWIDFGNSDKRAIRILRKPRIVVVEESQIGTGVAR